MSPADVEANRANIGSLEGEATIYGRQENQFGEPDLPKTRISRFFRLSGHMAQNGLPGIGH